MRLGDMEVRTEHGVASTHGAHAHITGRDGGCMHGAYVAGDGCVAEGMAFATSKCPALTISSLAGSTNSRK